MGTGLTKRDVKTLTILLNKYSTIKVVYIFGSRAKGNYHKGSDIDLAIMNEGVHNSDLVRLKSDLEESNLPYSVDIINFSELTNKDLIEHINKIGKPFYSKK